MVVSRTKLSWSNRPCPDLVVWRSRDDDFRPGLRVCAAPWPHRRVWRFVQRCAEESGLNIQAFKPQILNAKGCTRSTAKPQARARPKLGLIRGTPGSGEGLRLGLWAQEARFRGQASRKVCFLLAFVLPGGLGFFLVLVPAEGRHRCTLHHSSEPLPQASSVGHKEYSPPPAKAGPCFAGGFEAIR